MRDCSYIFFSHQICACAQLKKLVGEKQTKVWHSASKRINGKLNILAVVRALVVTKRQTVLNTHVVFILRLRNGARKVNETTIIFYNTALILSFMFE